MEVHIEELSYLSMVTSHAVSVAIAVKIESCTYHTLRTFPCSHFVSEAISTLQQKKRQGIYFLC